MQARRLDEENTSVSICFGSGDESHEHRSEGTEPVGFQFDFDQQPGELHERSEQQLITKRNHEHIAAFRKQLKRHNIIPIVNGPEWEHRIGDK